MLIEIITNAGRGAVLGMVAAARGYVKSIPDAEGMDWSKAGPTVIVGAIVGGAAGLLSLDYTSVESAGFGYIAIEFANTAWIFVTKQWFKSPSQPDLPPIPLPPQP